MKPHYDKGDTRRSEMMHDFEDAGFVTNEAKGLTIHLQNCTRCLLTVASDIPYDTECDGVPTPARQKIYDLTEGLRPEIAKALGRADARYEEET